MSSRWRAALFDFDYTLGDSSPAAVDCMRYALAQLGLPDVDSETCARTVGLPLPATFEVLGGPGHAPLLDAFLAHFMHRADEIMVPWTTVYPFTEQTLRRLRTAGLRVAVVSNKMRFRIEAILDLHGLRDLVDAVVGSEDVLAPKPAPDALLAALRALDVPAGAAVYVGDNAVDGEAALAAGVPFVGVTTGHTTADTLRHWTPVAVLDDAGGVPALLGLS
jgi:phosphoglycolate phosphatase